MASLRVAEELEPASLLLLLSITNGAGLLAVCCSCCCCSSSSQLQRLSQVLLGLLILLLLLSSPKAAAAAAAAPAALILDTLAAAEAAVLAATKTSAAVCVCVLSKLQPLLLLQAPSQQPLQHSLTDTALLLLLSAGVSLHAVDALLLLLLEGALGCGIGCRCCTASGNRCMLVLPMPRMTLLAVSCFPLDS